MEWYMGNLERCSLLVTIKVRMISFWAKLHFTPNIEKLSIRIYYLVYKKDFQWLRFIKTILNECGLSYLWTTESFFQPCLGKTESEKNIGWSIYSRME
jgi:hypothetical protein